MNPLDTGDEFTLELMNPNPTSSKTKMGPVYRVSFEMTQDAWQQFMDANTNGMILEVTGRATEIPVTKLDPMGKAPEFPSIRPKGGPISKHAAMLCNSDLGIRFAHEHGYEDLTEMVYAQCNITSRAELDHNPQAAESYENLKSRFLRWSEGK